MDEDTLGFSAKAPVGVWNKQIGVDYPGVFKALIKATIAYATGNAPSGLSATIDGLFAFKLQDKPLPPAELAWLLIRRSLANAMARLSVEALSGRLFFRKESDSLIAALDQVLDAAKIWIDPVFFDRPSDLPVVEAVRAPFNEWLRDCLDLDAAKAASVQQRFGAYFTFALRHEWAEHLETYAPIDVELRKLETPFAKASARERAWLRNAAYLERQINEPVFDETFGLAQIYVPPRAWYSEAPASRNGQGREEDTRERRRVVDLERHLDAWFASGDKEDAIRVICGGPGSGKTSFAKLWAARLARDGHRVLFVPLHRLELRDERPDVQAALWEFLRDLDVLPVDPLDSSDGEPRLLILFDGLDELAMQGRAGQQVARNFVEAVERKIDLLNDRNDRFVQAAFGGREIAVQSTRFPGHQALHVLPYHGMQLKEFEDPENLLEADRYACHRWWQRFGEAVGEDYRGVPEPLQGDGLAEITAQPLLNYLLALTYRRGELDFSSAANLNLIYQDLLRAVYERRWGPGRHPTKKQLTREEFDDLLDELGLAAWHGAGRMVTETQVEQACERAGLQEQLAAFQEGARAGAIGLLVAFYFRQTGKIEGERTFEFTHKSFGEYLTARRIVRWMQDIHEERTRNRDSRQRGWPVEDSLVKWAEITGPIALDRDLLAFLEREVALRTYAILEDWRKTFAELLNDQLEHGLPMQRLQLPTFREMKRQARNVEEALLAAHFCCANEVQKSSKVRWPSSVALRDLLTWLQQGREGRALARDCLGWLDAHDDSDPQKLPGAHLYRAKLVAVDLCGADLSRANLESADLARANLEGANLLGTIFFEANLAGAHLAGANLDRADLRRADLAAADLRRADLAGANLTRANLTGANLEVARLFDATLDAANLTGANLYRSDLEGAHLALATLEGAHLERANLERVDFALANLVGARLKEANLERAKLGGARLSAAVLEEAHLRWANLEHATLGGADLTRADLRTANLSGAQLSETNLTRADLRGANLRGADLARANLERANLAEAVLLRVANLDAAQNLELVRSWQGARIERSWVERLGLDAEQLSLDVVDDPGPD